MFHLDWWLVASDDVVEGFWEWSSTGKQFSISDFDADWSTNMAASHGFSLAFDHIGNTCKVHLFHNHLIK